MEIRKISVIAIAVLLIFAAVYHSQRVNEITDELDTLIDKVEQDADENSIDELISAWDGYRAKLACTFSHNCLDDLNVKIHTLAPVANDDKSTLLADTCEIRLRLNDLRETQRINLANLF